MMTRSSIVIAGAGALLAAASVVIYAGIISPRRNLDRCLRELAAVEVGKTTWDVWHQRVDLNSREGSGFACQQQDCSFAFINSLLSKLRLAPRTIIAAQLQFKRGIASEIYVWVEVNDAPDAAGVMYAGTGATIHQTVKVQDCNQHYSSYAQQRGQHLWGIVTMDSCVSAEDHAKAFIVNCSCLTKLGGCKTPDAILPQVFGKS
jgi:hypothetical protein